MTHSNRSIVIFGPAKLFRFVKQPNSRRPGSRTKTLTIRGCREGADLAV
jgi:hypothetical protein